MDYKVILDKELINLLYANFYQIHMSSDRAHHSDWSEFKSYVARRTQLNDLIRVISSHINTNVKPGVSDKKNLATAVSKYITGPIFGYVKVPTSHLAFYRNALTHLQRYITLSNIPDDKTRATTHTMLANCRKSLRCFIPPKDFRNLDRLEYFKIHDASSSVSLEEVFPPNLLKKIISIS